MQRSLPTPKLSLNKTVGEGAGRRPGGSQQRPLSPAERERDSMAHRERERDRERRGAETYHDVTEHKQAETTEGESSQQSAALQGELPQPEEGADYSEAHRARMVCRGSAVPDEDTPPDWGDEQTDDDPPHDNNWPWGESGRPSDQGHSEGILGQRPSEPEGAPRDGGIRLLPNRMWQAIRAVQSHMERSRQHRGNSSEGGFSS